MSKKLFSKAEQDHLSKNKHVTKVSDKAVTYSDEFKRLFIDQYMEGKTPREIFEAHGFNVEVLGMKRGNYSLITFPIALPCLWRQTPFIIS